MEDTLIKSPEFVKFGKIARLARECVITEKIDGTNAQIYIDDEGNFFIGSRKRWLNPGKKSDNFGFATWAEENKEELMKLGPGRHFGEWWGKGIQRGYNLEVKKFSLFNIARWKDTPLPICVSLVPLLAEGIFNDSIVNDAMEQLKSYGSLAHPGFKKPEGIVIFHKHSGYLFKKTLEDDEVPKGTKS